MSRSWWSNVRGAADWATRNRWDFDNLGRPSSVADNNPAGVYDNNDSGYQGGMSDSWAKAYDVAKNYNRNREGYIPGYVSGGSFGWPSKGVTPLSASTTLVNTMPNWGKYQIYNPPQKQGGGFLGTAMKIGSFFAPPGIREGLQVGSQLV